MGIGNEDEDVVDRAARVVVEERPSQTSESDILKFGMMPKNESIRNDWKPRLSANK
jgi:hypothetical protein